MAKIEPFPIFDMREIRTNEEIARHEYGIVDPWGRAIGVVIKTWEATFVVEESVGEWEHQSFYTLDRAERNAAACTAKGPFALFMQQTRNGSIYGASQRSSQFHTKEDRDAAIAKYLKQARKTAEKSVAKQAAKRTARQAAKAR